MSLYKRGDVYWYDFRFKGERIQESSHTSNKEAARQIESAHRVRLAKGEAGIIERPAAPTLEEFGPRFTNAITTLCANKPATVSFYASKLKSLIAHAPLASLPVISGCKIGRRRRSWISRNSTRRKDTGD